MPSPVHSIAWDDVRLVHAVAGARSLPAAAARLGINHSTVFRRLRQLEAMLGVALFERHRSGYVPTAAGEAVVALAGRVDADINDVTRRLAGLAPVPEGEVRIATSDSLLAELLLPMLVRFRRAHPAIRLDVVTGNAALNLSRRDADIALRATPAPPDTLVGRRLARLGWALYGPAAAQAAEPPPLAQLLEEAQWLSLSDALGHLAAARFLRGRVAEARIAGRFDSVQALVLAVRAGLGIAHLPCFAGDASPDLRRLAPPEPGLATELWLLTHPDLRHTPRIRVMLDHLADEIASLRGRIEGAA
ncbi:LysR family transcriptional regulator [Teichococcus vastitatis]|uniref:LysR family transcriptional regulator n=1 Tax=Teichococcus vastitatis TaxID=2307076 RepID=A0ABS9W3A4_9PROT|nr:LysR family transcriptional regulator [Pseudoroseomonas vastitatis]MCI0753692.1 LysR family transcriptional regulator [Pseudoroseomonas vastitatis]